MPKLAYQEKHWHRLFHQDKAPDAGSARFLACGPCVCFDVGGITASVDTGACGIGARPTMARGWGYGGFTEYVIHGNLFPFFLSLFFFFFFFCVYLFLPCTTAQGLPTPPNRPILWFFFSDLDDCDKRKREKGLCESAIVSDSIGSFRLSAAVWHCVHV